MIKFDEMFLLIVLFLKLDISIFFYIFILKLLNYFGKYYCDVIFYCNKLSLS